MNKEVKELIDKLKDNNNTDDYDENGYFFALYISDKDLLLDYINQLEKENQKLKKMHNHYYKYAIDQENKYVVSKAITDWLKLWLEEEMLEGRSEENQWLMGCYDQCKETLDKIKELGGGSNVNL